MAIIKCKMCGGDLEVVAESRVAVCEYCGTQQTVPSADNEKKLTLFGRANRLRMACEFDKAAGVYESIVADFPEEAEAYWGLVLCKYGIEYVDDLATGKKIPTCHRSSFDSVMDDPNLEQALENADAIARRVYRDEAKAIEDLRKGIIEVSGKEEPYDIFICYKETDDSGDRTIDSVIAQEVYDALTEKGYRVFFSRITLEDKLGQEYEPYIFAALHSAKIMLAFGTDYEYYNAVWVKNEWSRFLQLIAAGEKKTLIPCYKNIDAYDMPKEFARLQAQDMGKVGAMQDLLRGIEKILPREKQVVKETVVVQQSAETTKVQALLERAFLFLEDGDWKAADEYCEKALDIDPKCAEGYLGKLMIDLRVKKQEELANCAEPFDENSNYQKVARFGDDALRAMLTSTIDSIKTRNENTRLEDIYTRAKEKMKAARTEEAYKEAAAMFESIHEYMDAAALSKECIESIKCVPKDEALVKARAKMRSGRLEDYEQAVKLLESIPSWKDADELLIVCQKKTKELGEADEASRKTTRKIAGIIVAAAAAVIAVILVATKVLIPNGDYKDAVTLMENGQYEEAIAAFEALGDYKQEKSLMNIEACNNAIREERYREAVAIMDAGNYADALSIFETLENYEDSQSKYEQCFLSIYGEELWNKVGKLNQGDTYTFGFYNNQDIEWRILAKEGTKILVISEEAVTCRVYDTYDESPWGLSNIRTWLNNTFRERAFSEEEMEMIPRVSIFDDSSVGDPTHDWVFLLSAAEAEDYFQNDAARKCKSTEVTEQQEDRGDPTGCWWWLRTPGHNEGAIYVSSTGRIYYVGTETNNSLGAVRPAMWIDFGA